MFMRMHVLQDEANDGTNVSAGGAGNQQNNQQQNADSTKPWYGDFKDTGVKEWLTAYKGAYPDPESVAMKALNLEKFVGAEKAGRGVITPKPDAKPEEWQAFYKKVGGVPEKPDGYKLPDVMAKDAMAVKFREYAHKTAMPPMFFDAAMNFMASETKSVSDGRVAEFEKRGEQDLLDLKTEWPGIEYDKNVELGRRAAQQFIPHKDAAELEDVLVKIEGALGTKTTMKLWAAIGGGIGEHGFVEGDGGSGIGGTGMTPEAARIRISELQKDKEWAKSFSSGDADKKAEWDKLHVTAYGSKKPT